MLRVTPGFADSFNSLPREPGFRTLFGNTEDPFFRNEFGFTGVMGWSFSDADAAGFFFDGDAGDFLVGESVFTGQLGWAPSPRWPPFAPISFFFVSTLPPRLDTEAYRLVFFDMRPNDGRAQGLAPVPEPGSIALLDPGWWVSMRRCDGVALSSNSCSGEAPPSAVPHGMAGCLSAR